MVRVSAFDAVRPLASQASRVASVPYDVVDRRQAAELAAGNPYSFLHVIRSEIDLPETTGSYEGAVYDKARENFLTLLSEGILVPEGSPRMFVYRLVVDDRIQIGLVCGCHVDDYHANIIKKHERTRPEKEDDRTRHMLTLGAQPGPVMMTFRDRPEFDHLVRHDINNRPLFHFVAADGVTHTVWTVADADAYRDLFASVDALYVADGHHRIASAARAAAERRAANPHHHGDEAYNWFLAALFPASALAIGPYHRVVADLGGQSPEAVLGRLAEVGTLTETDQPRPPHVGVFGIYLKGQWHRLELDPASIDRSDPVRSLDVFLLQERVLEPILGIKDPRSDKRLEFVGGSEADAELARRVDRDTAAIAFCLYPTSIEQLLDVADAELIMPPKSTWFEPKLRSGLFVHVINGTDR